MKVRPVISGLIFNAVRRDLKEYALARLFAGFHKSLVRKNVSKQCTGY